MNEAILKEKLEELCKAIARSPKAKSAPNQDDGIYVGHTGEGKTSVEKTLETLRLEIKYIVFDLEATRRENYYLRQMLENRSKRPNDR